MEREQITKALECHISGKLTNCEHCPFDKTHLFNSTCVQAMCENALSLIKELTEENERLRTEVNKLDALSDEMGVDIDVKLKTIFELEDKLKAEKADVMYFKDQIKADTVRRMQSDIQEACLKGGIWPTFVAGVVKGVGERILEEYHV
jgi:hypothetical protein